MIRFVCRCGRQLQAREDDVGKKAKCPSCQRVMTVPAEEKRRQRTRSAVVRDDPDEDSPRRGRRDDYDDYDDDRGYTSVATIVTSGKAIAALVIGLISICLPIFFTSLLGLILGISALRQIGRSEGRIGGRGMAITGIAASCLSFLLLIPLGFWIFSYLAPEASLSPAAIESRDANNLKEISSALLKFHDVNGRFPEAIAYRTPDGRPALSWRVALLPYLNQAALYHRFKLDEPWDSPNNQPLIEQMPEVFATPGKKNDGVGRTRYQVFVGPKSMFEVPDPPLPKRPDSLRLGLRVLDATDGSALTILVTACRTPVIWTKPDDMIFDPKEILPPLSDHIPGSVHVAFADGSVKLFPLKTLDPTTLKAMITRNGGEVFNLP